MYSIKASSQSESRLNAIGALSNSAEIMKIATGPQTFLPRDSGQTSRCTGRASASSLVALHVSDLQLRQGQDDAEEAADPNVAASADHEEQAWVSG